MAKYFNPRSPCGERHLVYHWPIVSLIFQSTLPVWGATRELSPRKPVGIISIHAPRVGSDRQPAPGSDRELYFNPRSPCGERRLSKAWICSVTYFNPRSPCGERRRGSVCLPAQYNFNPRSPCGERRQLFHRHSGLCGISIHAPRVGSDLTGPGSQLPAGISIHAPRVGSDGLSNHRRAPPVYFNPRSPCGERPEAQAKALCIALFQSTLPVWGATGRPSTYHLRSVISIHAPRVGSDGRSWFGQSGRMKFQSTLPVWGATASMHKNILAHL